MAQIPTSPLPLAIITGASSGIGRATAQLLAKNGHRTLLIARRIDRLNDLAAELSPHAPSAALQLDLEDEAGIAPAIAAAMEEHGPADLLINNAGVGICMPMLEQSLADHHRIMQVNYFAAVQMIHSILPTMLERRRGHIINVASMSGKTGAWGHAAYAATKSALIALTQSMSTDYAKTGVSFSYVNPGIVCTEFFDNPGYDGYHHQVNKRGISAQRVARAILRLIRRPKLEICVPAIYRAVDWLIALSPSLAHWVVSRESRPNP